jgi:hypothetical protein
MYIKGSAVSQASLMPNQWSETPLMQLRKFCENFSGTVTEIASGDKTSEDIKSRDKTSGGTKHPAGKNIRTDKTSMGTKHPET